MASGAFPSVVGAVGVSGVIAAVTVGIYMGWHTPELTTAQVRLQGVAVWEVVFLILNALLFALVVRGQFSYGRAAFAFVLSLLPFGTFYLDKSLRADL